VELTPLLLADSDHDPVLLPWLADTDGVDPDFVVLLVVEDAESQVLGVVAAEGTELVGIDDLLPV